MDDPRLANTGVRVLGREIIDDAVLLADFERILEAGEAAERGEDPFEGKELDSLVTLLRFIDCHGRQLLWLARKGAA